MDGCAQLVPLFEPGVNVFEVPAEERSRIQECRKLLLEAGADPMEGTAYFNSPFFDSFSDGIIVSTTAISLL